MCFSDGTATARHRSLGSLRKLHQPRTETARVVVGSVQGGHTAHA